MKIFLLQIVIIMIIAPARNVMAQCCINGKNLLANYNPDFSAPNTSGQPTGFRADGTFVTTPTGGGTYLISPSRNYGACGGALTQYDHTKGDATGRFLWYDTPGGASLTSPAVAWKPYDPARPTPKQSLIDVTPNTDYVFAVWIRDIARQSSCSKTDAPIMGLRINGVDMAQIDLAANYGTSPPCCPEWTYLCTAWNSGNDTTAEIRVESRKGSGFTDLAIDDVYFGTTASPDVSGVLGKDTSVCAGDTLILYSPFPTASNLWNTGSTDSFLKITTPGKYWLDVTQSGCTGRDTIEVFQGVPPVVNLGSDTLTCGEPILLRSSVAYTNPLWKWSNGAATQTILASQSGKYWLEVKESGCTGADTIEVTIQTSMTVDLGNDFAICDKDGPVILNATFPPGTQYLWSNGLSDTQMMVIRSGRYWLEVRRNVCIGSDTINIKFVPTPVVNIGPDSIICEQFPAVIGTEIAGATYLWSTGEHTGYIRVSNTDRYTLAVDLEGCIVRDTVDITAMPLPEITLGLDGDICPEQTIILDAAYASGCSYVWNTGETSSRIAVTSAGLYYVRVTSEYGCIAGDSILLTYYPKPTVWLGYDTTVCEETPLWLAPFGINADSLQWSDGSTGERLLVRYGGEYIVTGINKCGTGSDTVYVRQVFCDIAVPSAFTPNGDGSNDVFRVLGNVGRLEGFRFSIFSRWGEQVFRTEDKHQGWDGMCKNKPSLLGTYVYMLEYSIAGKPYFQKGNFHLIR